MSLTTMETKTEAKAAKARRGRKIAMLGCGKLGTILLQAFIDSGLVAREDAIATIHHEDRCRTLSAALGRGSVTTHHRRAAPTASIVTIPVHPQTTAPLPTESAPPPPPAPPATALATP